LLYQVQAGSEWIWFAEFTPDNKTLVTASGNTVRVWDTASGAIIGEVPVFETVGNINDFALTSHHLITAHSESGDWAGGIILWELANLKEQKRYTTPTHVNFVDSSSDGQWMLTYESSRSQYTLFNVETGEVRNTFPGFTPNLNGRRLAAYSPNNTYLVTIEDIESTLWNLSTGTIAHQFVGHRDVIFDTTFSHDGQFVVTLSNDGTVRLWDTARGAELRRITMPFSPISVNFSTDDRQLIILGSDERIHFVHVAIADSLRQLCERLRRDFTSEERDQYQVIETSPSCSRSM
jgi:WD40 repeat protein